MSIRPRNKTYEVGVMYQHAGLSTSQDSLCACYATSGFPDSFTVKGPSCITQMYLLWDGELVTGWSAGTVQFRVYNKGVLILDTGALSNTITKNVSYTGILAVTSAMTDLSDTVSLPLAINDRFSAIQVRATVDASFPAIDAEIGIQLFFEKPI